MPRLAFIKVSASSGFLVAYLVTENL